MAPFDRSHTSSYSSSIVTMTVSCTVFAARCYASAALAVMRCLSVCVSVDCVKTNKHIFKIFSPSGSHMHHSSFSRIKRFGNILTGTLLTAASNAGRRQKTRFWTNIWLRCTQVYSVVNRTSCEV